LNSSTWFNSSINDDVIEEYFISTLMYDKKNGETIRIKVNNIDDINENELYGRLTIALTLKNIKFFQQKFFPEFHIETIEIDQRNKCLEFLDDSDSDECGGYDAEAPLPSFEEIQLIKEDCLEKLKKEQNRINTMLIALQESIARIKDSAIILENCHDMANIMKLCEEYQNLLCD
jgi:hypothetical protein